MTPLAHAMGLVDGEQRQLALGVQIIEQAQKARCVQALGRRIEQGDVAALQAQLHLAGFVVAEGGVQIGGTDAGLVQRADLIVHQRNQRRDHDAHPMAQLLTRNGRHLIAQRFAAARGHEHQRIATRDHVRDDGLLRATKLLVAKDGLQNGLRGRHRVLFKQ